MKPVKASLMVFLVFLSMNISTVLANSEPGKKSISGRPAISEKDVEGYVTVIESINRKLKDAVAPAIKEKNENDDKNNTAAILSAISVLKTDLKTLESEACKTAGMEPEKYRETQVRLSQVLAYLSVKKGIKDDGKYSPKAFKDEFSQNFDKEIQKQADALEKAKAKKQSAIEEEKAYFAKLNEKLLKEKEKKAKIEEKLSSESDSKKKENLNRQLASSEKAISGCEAKLNEPFSKLKRADENVEKARKRHEALVENRTKIIEETAPEKTIKDHEANIEEMKKKLEEPSMKQAALDLPVFKKFGDRVTIVGAGVFSDKKAGLLSSFEAE